MTVQPSEYESLRAEVLQRHDRIHSSLVWAVAGVATVVSYSSSGIEPETVLALSAILQVFLALLAAYIDDNYNVLYKMGTYLCFTYEKNELSGPRWHRMTRSFWSHNRTKGKKSFRDWLFQLWSPWGTGGRQAAFTIGTLGAINLLVLVIPNRSVTSWKAIALLAVCGLFTVSMGFPLRRLWLLLERRRKFDREWKDFHYEFELSEEAAAYSKPTPESVKSQPEEVERPLNDG